MRSHRRTARPVLVALALFVVATGCGRGRDRDPESAAERSASRLEAIVADQRAQPAQTPAVADRGDVAPVLTERWRWPSPDGGNVGLAATDDRGVVTTHTERHLVALDADGRLAWSVEHAGLRPVEPLLAGDLVVAAAEDDVVAVDRQTGARRWATSIGHERANAPALAGDALVVVTTWQGRLLALDRASGVVTWSTSLPGESLWRPVAADGVVVAAWDSGWGGFDLADGRPRWSAELWPDGVGSPAIAARRGGHVAIVTSGGRIDANDLATGRERWRTTTWVDTSIDQAITAVGGPRPAVVVPDREGGVTVLDATSGDLLWFRAGGDGDLAERGRPVVLPDDLVAYALDAGGVRLAWAGGHTDRDPGGLVAGVAALGRGLVATTWQGPQPAVVAFDVLARPGNR